MDRQLVYPGQIPLETDLLNTNRNTLIGLGKLMGAVFGSSTLLNGLSCIPTSPAALQVWVNPGEIYSLQNLDGTAYSSIAADTTHQIVKQGILLDRTTLNCPAPGTVGQSINYLVQVTYQDTDTGSTVLPYYNSSNPSQAWSGPNNSGTPQYTTRAGQCIVSAKAGTAAATGSQTTPAPDSGYVGAFVVTVAYGQSTILAGNISTYASAPFLNSTLLGINPAFTVTPIAPDPASVADSSQKLATTSWIRNAMGNIATAAGFAISTGANGYLKFPTWLGGLLIQWGGLNLIGSPSTDAANTGTFPIAFPNLCLCMVANSAYTITSNTFNGFIVQAPSSKTQYVLRCNVTTFANWIAIGY